ncbi:hypothetical protein EMCG_09531 [[Emmonsia] crescens]|uniref:Uncharacterized protein n=1 Tax=[Emmonsia] crescens TaxID=73230 RepID=A0A0G2J2W6_9EURO|nr:hypothetical protein EMCG_09531 [Emmonsia crescens UAMH 3008]
MAAWKVHVQSGNFSFYFQHKVGDSGMGMVSPVWEDTEESLDYPLTRITLFLHETGSDGILAKQRETTLQQFRELQATYLLFMKNLRRGRASANEAKETIWLLNSYLEGENELPNPKRLKASKVFPVKHPNGTVELCNFATDFAITYRNHLLGSFSGKAKFLDFGVNDVLRLEPFLQRAGLEARYLSSSVKEISALVGNSHRSLASPDRNIARKFMVCSDELQATERTMRNEVRLTLKIKISESQFISKDPELFDICETDEICSRLHLNQDENDIKVEVSRSELHLYKNEAGLAIYVLQNECAQCICFLDRISEALLEWIMTESSTAICELFSEKALNAMQRVLQVPNEYILL